MLEDEFLLFLSSSVEMSTSHSSSECQRSSSGCKEEGQVGREGVKHIQFHKNIQAAIKQMSQPELKKK